MRGQKPKTSTTTLPYSTHQLGHLASHPHCSDPYHDGLLACCGLRVLAFWIAYLVALWTPCSPCKLKPISVKDSHCFAVRGPWSTVRIAMSLGASLAIRAARLQDGMLKVLGPRCCEAHSKTNCKQQLASPKPSRSRLKTCFGPRSVVPVLLSVQAYCEGHCILGGSAQTGQAKIVQGHAEGC